MDRREWYVVSDLHLNRDRARAFGAAGYERARGVTWSGVIEHLIGESSPA